MKNSKRKQETHLLLNVIEELSDKQIDLRVQSPHMKQPVFALHQCANYKFTSIYVDII